MIKMKLSFYLITVVILISLQNTNVMAQSVTGYDYQAGTEFNYKLSNIYDNYTTFINHDPHTIPLLNSSDFNNYSNVTISNHLFVNNEVITAYLKNDVNNSVSRDEILICLVNFTSFLTIPTFKMIYSENNRSITYDFNNSEILGPLMNHFPILYRSFAKKSDVEFFIQAYPQVTHETKFNFSIDSNYINYDHYSVENSGKNTTVAKYSIKYNWKTGIFTSYTGYFSFKDDKNVVRIYQYNLNYIDPNPPKNASTPFYSASLFIALPIAVIFRRKLSKILKL